MTEPAGAPQVAAARFSEAQLRDLPLEQRVFGPIFLQRITEDADRPFLTAGADRFTYGAFGARTLALARGLARQGVGPGSVVPILLPNGAAFVMAWFAVHLRGATMALLNPALKGRLLEAALRDCRPRLAIVGAAQRAELAALDPQALEGLETIVVVGAPATAAERADSTVVSGRSTVALEALMDDAGPDPVVPTSFEQVQSIFFTSGSTGPAKGVLMPNAHFFANPCTFLRLSGLQRDDVLHTSLPLFHGVGSRQGVLPAFMIGARVDLGEKFSASRFWRTVAQSGATVALLTPSMTPVLAALPPDPAERSHRLRLVYNVQQDPAFEARFGVRMLVSFAITEIGVVIYSRPPERRAGAMGLAHEDWELAIVDEADRPVPHGAAGELVCRPRRPFIMMQGYLNRPEAAAQAWRNLWYHTGDYLRQDEDGWFHFAGRDKDRLRRRGENLSPLEIEHELRQHPAVADAVAVGYPAADGEDDIRVVLVARGGVDPPAAAALAAWLAGRLPASMVPRYWEFADALPLTATDKVDRRALREAGLAAAAWDRERPGPAPTDRPPSGT
jgi:crotonobetaine/carnitine-CoA ligase